MTAQAEDEIINFFAQMPLPDATLSKQRIDSEGSRAGPKSRRASWRCLFFKPEGCEQSAQTNGVNWSDKWVSKVFTLGPPKFANLISWVPPRLNQDLGGPINLHVNKGPRCLLHYGSPRNKATFLC